MWFLLFFASFIIAMEPPVPLTPLIKKYSCCPDKFGYRVIGIDKRQNREIVNLYGNDAAQDFDDTGTSIQMRDRLFKCLLLELLQNTHPEARRSFECLIERMRIGRIRMADVDGGCIYITHKDFLLRMLAHLPAYIDDGGPNVFVSNNSLGLIFVPCIHQINSFGYKFFTRLEGDLFGEDMMQEFMRIKPFPSLISLCVTVVKKHRKQDALKMLPEELKPLVEH